MARQIRELLIDDIDGGEAHESLSFAIDGSTYEIDLHAEKADGLRRALAPFIGKARPVRRTRPAKGSRGLSRDKSRQVRAWARERGIPVPDRGRVPHALVDQYDAGHS